MEVLWIEPRTSFVPTTELSVPPSPLSDQLLITVSSLVQILDGGDLIGYSLVKHLVPLGQVITQGPSAVATWRQHTCHGVV